MTRHPLHGCWDHPQQDLARGFGTPFARDGRLTLVGWALGDDTPTIEVSIDGRLTGSTQPTFYREDIEIIFGHTYPLADGLTGWATTVDAADVSPGSHVVSVRARTSTKNVALGDRRFAFAPPQEPPDASLRRLEPLLRSHSFVARKHQALFSSEPGEWVRHATSVFGFSAHARHIAADAGLTLVVGAGIAPTADRVFQLDIFDYPNVDVVSNAPELPFVDGSFDGVICENVIEHVPDPFALVAEIQRVLKPGGRLGINGTNLHFTHGFPSHFFNATEFGMRYLLEERGGFEGRYEFANIRQSLRTVLTYYLNALTPDARARVEGMRLRDLFTAVTTDDDTGATATLSSLSPKAEKALSTNIYFVGRKRA